MDKPADLSEQMDAAIGINSTNNVMHNSNEVGCSTCKRYSKSLKNLLQCSSDCISESLAERREDLHFVQAIVWLKHAVASMKEISLADFQSAFTYRENVHQNCSERPDRRIVHEPSRNSYETQNISQASVNTIEELFTRRKPRNNEEEEVQILIEKESRITERHSPLNDNVLTLADVTGSAQRYADKNLPENRTILQTNSCTHNDNPSSPDIFDESGTSTHFNSPELQPDNTDCTVSDFGPANELTRGNAFQSLGSFSSMRLFNTSATANSTGRSCSFTGNSRNLWREHKPGRTDNIDKTIVNNCSSLSMVEEEDSGYSTLQLVPRSSKSMLHSKRKLERLPVDEARWKSRRIECELFETELERWESDSNAEQCRMLSRSVSDLHSRSYSCGRSLSSMGRFTSEFKCDDKLLAQANKTDCSQLTATNSLESLCSSLHESLRNTSISDSIWSSKLPRNSKTFASVRHDGDVEIQEGCDNEDDCQTVTNLITPERTSICSRGSFRLTGELHFSPLSRTSINSSLPFRHGEECGSFGLSTIGEQSDFSARQESFKTMGSDGLNIDLFTPIANRNSGTAELTIGEHTDFCAGQESFKTMGSDLFTPIDNRKSTTAELTIGDHSDFSARQESFKTMGSDGLNTDLFTPIDNRNSGTAELTIGEHSDFCARQETFKTMDTDLFTPINNRNSGTTQLTIGEHNDFCARQESFKMQDSDGLNIDLFTPIDNRKLETVEEEEKLSSAYLNFVLDSMNVDNAVSKFVNVILGSFEDGRITKAYVKGRRWENTLEKEAIRTVLLFCCVFEGETKSSAITRSIVEMVERSLDRTMENGELCNMTERMQHVSILLEFVCFKDVCITIIDHLILKLESYTKDVILCASKTQLPLHESLSKLQLVMYALKICLKKYRLLRSNNEEDTSETWIADAWCSKRQPRSSCIAKAQNAEEIEERWMNVLEKLPVILVDDFFYLALESRALKTLLMPN